MEETLDQRDDLRDVNLDNIMSCDLIHGLFASAFGPIILALPVP